MLVQCNYQGLKGFTASELKTLIELAMELRFYFVLSMIVVYRVMKKLCVHNFGCNIKFIIIFFLCLSNCNVIEMIKSVVFD